jgi:hypothetical protein
LLDLPENVEALGSFVVLRLNLHAVPCATHNVVDGVADHLFIEFLSVDDDAIAVTANAPCLPIVSIAQL